MKKLITSVIATMLTITIMITPISGLEINATFVQNTDTQNGHGFVDEEIDQFETYSNVSGNSGNYTSIASKIYKPVSGDTLIVVFHGNGEGGVEGNCNNYAQLAGNRLAVTYTTNDVQEAFKGAYVLAFQAPDYWYNDYTDQAKNIIDQAMSEFGIKQVFISGLSAGGLMCQRMLAKYGSFFDGALFSCAAIAKNNQYVQGLGGNYESPIGFLDAGDAYTDGKTFLMPSDIDNYIANYNKWLENIAASDVPIFMVHCYYDTTIYYKWTEYAYNYIKDYRDSNGLTGDIYYNIIDDVSYPDETYSSSHWSWIKMLNGDIYASTDSTLDTISWFESLSTSTNNYIPKSYTLSTAGVSDQENTFKYNLIATVTNSGEMITGIEIDMNGTKVDSSKLTPEMFKITGYNYDASGVVDSFESYGIFGSELEPEEIEVATVEINETGNIVLQLATIKGVLNYTSLLRNLTTNIRYNIESVALPVIEKTTDVPATTDPTTMEPTADTSTTAVKTGDDTNIILFGGLFTVSVLGYIGIKRKFD